MRVYCKSRVYALLIIHCDDGSGCLMCHFLPVKKCNGKLSNFVSAVIENEVNYFIFKPNV
jgi:hypothetical protein